MGILVQKYGGTSVGTLDRINSVAKRIKTSIEQGHRVVIVVSAMAGVTNQLVSYANSVHSYEGDREYDVIISSGEQIAAGLIAMSLKNFGLDAKSYMAWQLPIITDTNHGQANILDVYVDKIIADIELGVIPIICGFQGVSKLDEVTTIGRGGSDLTAVAVAAALKADVCEIYSDVDGVYTADPNKITSAKLIKSINYNEMLEFSLNGAKVLQGKAIDYAMKHNVRIRAASSFINSPGTLVSGQKSMDRDIIGICSSSSLVNFSASCSKIEKIVDTLNDNFIRVIQKYMSDGECIITINHCDIRNACQALEPLFGRKYRFVFQNSELCNVSLVGLGIGDNKDIENIVKVSLRGIKIFNLICLRDSINITVRQADELAVLTTLHNMFV